MSEHASRLNGQTLARLPAHVIQPRYDRSALDVGIVHLGIGAFHRAHQAVMTEAAVAAGDKRWGIVGASLRSPAIRDMLAPQDWLYSVTSRDGANERSQVIGALRDVLVAPESPQALIGALARRSVKIVSLTITEKGYCHSPSTGDLAVDDPDIQHDLANSNSPRTAFGFLAAALRQRRREGVPPPTLVSCDNLFGNGHTLKKLLAQFASLNDPDLARFVETDVASPNTMVDRIVPATTDDDRRHVASLLGLTDAGAIVTEPFIQWVIEDQFPSGRPEWERAGAEFVSDVAPFELMKLRLLNASHSAIAYLGALAGYETVAEAMGDDAIAGFVEALINQEVTPVLRIPSGFDVSGYKRALLNRFRNPALRHRTHQIAMDGSQKLPVRILETVRAARMARQPFARLALVVAAWMRYIQGRDERGQRYEIRDALQVLLVQRSAEAAGDPNRLVSTLLGVPSIFGHDLATDAPFVSSVTAATRTLAERGVHAAIVAAAQV